MFGRKPRAGLAIMNLGELEDGISAEEQLLEVLGDKNKEEENAEEVQAKEQPPGRIRKEPVFTVF